MESVWQWGLAIIRFIQSVHNPVLDSVFKAITFLSDEVFLMFLIPVFYWCVDFRLGVYLLNILMCATCSNYGLKNLFAQPRPFNLDPTVKLISEVGYGLPSAHSQFAVSIWGTIAAYFRKRWLWIAAIFLMLAIGFSRVYLGVHFPTDVLAGWVLGGILLALFRFLAPRLEKLLARIGFIWQLAIVAAIAVSVLAIVNTKETQTIFAIFLGGNAGVILIHRVAPFRVEGNLKKRLLCFAIGASGIVAVYFGLQALFPKDGAALYHELRVVRYLLMSFWITFLAPLIFHRFKLFSR